MPTTFIKANRKYKQANGEYSDPISYSTSSESVEMTDGTDLQTKIGTMDTAIGNKVDKVSGKGLSTNDYDNTAKSKVDALGTASTKDVPTSGNASATQVVMGNDSRLSDSRPASDVSAWAKESTKPTYTASEVGAIATTAKGSNNGVAELDSAGKVPSSQLPSYVDDVLEYDSLSQFPATGETGKIYIAKDTNLSYRWSGTGYVEISPSLALGETSSTAYRGDRGKTAYDHSQLTSGNPHNVSKSDVGLGNVGNFKAVSTVASQGLTDTEKSNARTNIGAGTSNFSGSYNDLSDKPDLDAKLDKAGGTMTGTIVTTRNTAIKPQTHDTGTVGEINNPYAGGFFDTIHVKGSNENGSFGIELSGAEDAGTIEFAKEADSDESYRQVFQNKDGTLALTSDIEVSEDDIASTKTVSGNPVTVTDAAPINAEDITVDITPVQDLHGYDRPWAGGEWKNKLDPTYLIGFNESGLKVVNNNGVLSITGNVSSPFNKRLASSVPLKADTYKISKGSSNTYPQLLVSYNHQYIAYVGATGQTITIPSDGVINIDMYTTAGNYSDTFYPMIRLATETDATFAPYSNICPIAGRTGAELDRVGKNLWNGEFSEQNAFLLSDGTTFSSASWKVTEYIRVVGGETYTISYSTSNQSGAYACWYDKNKDFIGSAVFTTGTSLTLTLPGNAEYIRASRKNDAMEYQIEEGSTATTYEPYQGAQYTANFGETVHGGKWHVTAGGTDKTYGNIASYNGETINEPWLSSLDEYVAGATPTTGAQVVYPLTTPTTISTPKQNVPMLKGVNTVSADCGDVSLKYQPDNVIGELKGEIEDTNKSIWDAFKISDSYTYYGGTSSGSGYQFFCDIYRRGGLVGIANFQFGNWQDVPVGSGEETLIFVSLISKYIPINNATFKFRHISGNGNITITLMTDGYVKFAWDITVAMTRYEASEGWLLEENDVQLAADLF